MLCDITKRLLSYMTRETGRAPLCNLIFALCRDSRRYCGTWDGQIRAEQRFVKLYPYPRLTCSFSELPYLRSALALVLTDIGMSSLFSFCSEGFSYIAGAVPKAAPHPPQNFSAVSIVPRMG